MPSIQRLLLNAAALIGVVAFSMVVPYDMDEFIGFTPLSCRAYPFASIDRHWCGDYDLNFLNTELTLPVRAYAYMGSFPALYYSPFFLIWPSPVSSRLMGLAFLAVGAWAVSRREGIRLTTVLAGMLLFLPDMFQHLVDPTVAFQITSALIVLLLLSRWAESLRPRYMVGVVALVFCGIWTKLSYGWILPGISLLGVHTLWVQRSFLLHMKNRRRFVRQGTTAAVGLGGLVAVLFLSTSPTNPAIHPLLDQARNADTYTVGEMLRGQWTTATVNLFESFINPLETSQRFFEVDGVDAISVLYGLLLFFCVPVAWVLSLTAVPAGNLLRGRSVIAYGAFLITCFMIVRTKSAWGVHHVIFAFPFLILSLTPLVLMIRSINGSRKKNVLKTFLAATGGLFVTLNVVSVVRIPFQPVKALSDASKQQLHRVLSWKEIAPRYVIVTADWGMYFYQALYGDAYQSVLYPEPIRSREQVEALRALSRQYQRKLLFTFVSTDSTSDIELLHRSFPLERCAAVPAEAVWQIVAMPDDDLRRICEEIGNERAAFRRVLKGVF